jgi:hypothetical protein
MPDDRYYEAVVEGATVHVLRTWAEFKEEPALAWASKTVSVPRGSVSTSTTTATPWPGDIELAQ